MNELQTINELREENLRLRNLVSAKKLNIFSGTPRMKKLYDFIKSSEMCPTYEEMQNYMGQGSKASVNRLIKSLEERGYIERIPGKARSIKVVAETH